MALLRQCLQELRLRQSEWDLLIEPQQPLGASHGPSSPTSWRRNDGLAAARVGGDPAEAWGDCPSRELHL